MPNRIETLRIRGVPGRATHFWKAPALARFPRKQIRTEHDMPLRDRVPWPMKIGAKLLLSRLPVSYATWRSLECFKKGEMVDAEYALTIFRRHFGRYEPRRPERGITLLELGPGDSLASALIAASHGVASTILLDTGPFAVKEMEPYRCLAVFLGERGYPVPDLGVVSTLEDLLSACNASYLVDGLAALRRIPDGSVDFLWSNAVLEHVSRDELAPILCETRRILAPEGLCSHSIDFRDHLGGSLNHLRFRDSIWESRWFQTSGFYTNRVRFPALLELFRAAGFEVIQSSVSRWDALPVKKSAMAAPFLSYSEDDLSIASADVVLAPARGRRA